VRLIHEPKDHLALIIVLRCDISPMVELVDFKLLEEDSDLGLEVLAALNKDEDFFELD